MRYEDQLNASSPRYTGPSNSSSADLRMTKSNLNVQLGSMCGGLLLGFLVLALYFGLYAVARRQGQVMFGWSAGTTAHGAVYYSAGPMLRHEPVGQACAILFRPAIAVEKLLREETDLILDDADRYAAARHGDKFMEFVQQQLAQHAEQADATDAASRRR